MLRSPEGRRAELGPAGVPRALPVGIYSHSQVLRMRAVSDNILCVHAPLIEYTRRSLDQFLGDQRRSPFEEYAVYRLVSGRIAAEAVRAEQRGGHMLNRAQRLMLGLGRRSAGFGALRGWVESWLFHLYSFLPEHNGFDFDGCLATFDFIRFQPELRDRDSFGLVAVLRKAGTAA